MFGFGVKASKELPHAYVDLTAPDLPPYDPLRFARWYERAIARWLGAWHGHGDWHQADYFRCHGCRRLVSWNAIRHGGCGCGISGKLSPARLPWWRKLYIIVAPWMVVR